MVKRIIIAAVFIGLGGVFFLQKQHERKEALELKKQQEEASVKVSAAASPANPSLQGARDPKPMTAPTSKPRPTPMLPPAPTAKPKPTPMLPKPTPMLGRSP